MPGAEARRAQNEQQITKITATEPPRDYAVMQVLRCWADLSTERTVGMAEGAMPWRAIVAWCEFEGFDHEATQLMIHVIRSLDIDRARATAAEAERKRALGPAGVRGRSTT